MYLKKYYCEFISLCFGYQIDDMGTELAAKNSLISSCEIVINFPPNGDGEKVFVQ